MQGDWWKTIFDGLYLATDARSVMSEELTAREVDFVLEFTGAGNKWDILDLCGGQGRHARELSQRGFGNTVVYDYSDYLLSYGRDICGEKVRFLRGDARDIGIKSDSFDLVIIMGNSFGYFPDDDENLKILKEAKRVLRGGGVILLDIIDRDYISENFRPRSVHTADFSKILGREGEITVTRTRSIGEGIVSSRELVTANDGGILRDSRYHERLYGKEEISELLLRIGFGGLMVEMGRGFHEMEGDFGFMESRMMIRGEKA
jgi:D-alanine-D-alanine ligase